MNWDMLQYFEEEKITATPYFVTESIGLDGYATITETAGDDIKGIKWNRPSGSRYFNLAWNEAVTAFFVVEEIGVLASKDKLKILDVTYDIDSIENIAEQGAVYLIGLKGRK